MTDNCDSCKWYWYSWYYGFCEHWYCKKDPRSFCNFYKKMDTPILDYMVNGGSKKKDD